MKRNHLIAIVFACLGFSAVAESQPQAPDFIALIGKPEAQRRAVFDHGDEPVIEGIEGDRVDIALGAVQAAPFMYEPERVLGRLAELAGGRDPDLAPVAAVAVYEISVRLAESTDIERRELVDDDLDETVERLETCRADESARLDIRNRCGVSGAMLKALREWPDGQAPAPQAAEED